jgi:hypothetical protein
MQLVAAENAVDIRDAVVRALRSARYSVSAIQLVARYTDGEPAQHVEVRTREVPEHDLSRLSDDELQTLEQLLAKATPERSAADQRL